MSSTVRAVFAGTGSTSKRTLILGTAPLARELVDAIRCRARSPYALLGVVREPGTREAPPFTCPILGSFEDLERIVAVYRPECIIVALAERRRCMPVRRLIEARVVQGIVVENGDEVYERLTGKLAIDALTPSSVLFSQDFRPSGAALMVARVMSLVAATVGLIVLAPVWVFVAAAIMSESRGPVFFIQDRIGLKGRRFPMIKFRTMRPAAGPRSEWVRDNDDRITRVGRWLRKYRLDELPQLVNILRGDMNLVGPRPHPVSNHGLLELVSRNIPECGEQIPYYSLRSLVRPGITGWAQTYYRYANDLDEEIEKLRYDLYYIKRYSIRLDLRILLETIKVVLSGREAQETTTTVEPARGANAAVSEAAPLEAAVAASSGGEMPAMAGRTNVGPSTTVMNTS